MPLPDEALPALAMMKQVEGKFPKDMFKGSIH